MFYIFVNNTYILLYEKVRRLVFGDKNRATIVRVKSTVLIQFVCEIIRDVVPRELYIYIYVRECFFRLYDVPLKETSTIPAILFSFFFFFVTLLARPL